MSREDAFQLARHADDIREIGPTHQLAADMRAAAARLRHNAQRAAARLALRPMPTAESVDAAFARIFGEG